MPVSYEEFRGKFTFRPLLRGHVGVEREFFLTGGDRQPVPRSHEFLELVDDAAWTYELSGCQVEHRTQPCGTAGTLRNNLVLGRKRGERAARKLGLRLSVMEVGPEDMPLAIYPHDPRYAQIAERIGEEKLRAACRVTGVHLHIGVVSLYEAIQVHNRFVPYVVDLCRLGDHSSGERLRLYSQMAIRGEPPIYRSPQHFYEVACAANFADNPRNCWDLVRISRHGTVELRMFGMTSDTDEILHWVDMVLEVAELG